MGHVQTGLVFLGKIHSLRRRSQTGLLAANQGMQTDLRVITPRFLSFLHIAVDDARVFTMGHDWQTGRGEDTVQRLIAVYQHIACAATHKELDARNAVNIQLVEERHVIVGGTKEERIVYMTLLRRPLELIVEGLVVVCGTVLGISKYEVTPPAAAARLSLSISAFSVIPGSRKCT